jgi:enolase
MTILDLKARKILNSSGNWTIECELTTKDQKVSASVPTGISTGKDEKADSPIVQALNEVEKEILPKLKNQDLTQAELDQILDKNDWGSNATLAVSAAFFKLKEVKREKVPQMMMLIFEGEKHGNPDLTIQEFMIVTDKIEKGVNFYKQAQNYLKKRDYLDTVGSEGGMSPKELTDKEILKILTNLGADKIALDVAGNENPPSVKEMFSLIKNYPLFSLEDPFPETKPDQWQKLFEKNNEEVLIVGDDLTVTDPEKISRGANKLFNAVIIKPNQQGTITKAVQALKTAKQAGLKTIVSHRGQETNDTWIADFALTYQSDFVKFGAPTRGERIAKYNRLLESI